MQKTLRVPIVKASTLWHWGDLEITDKGENGRFEGNLFSMSACPNAWRQICKLGAKPLHQSVAPSFLVDAHAIYTSNAHYAKRMRAEIEQWGIDQGHISLETVHCVEILDEDDETTLQFFYMTREEAEAEANDPDEIEERKMLVATEQFKQMHGFAARHVIGSEYVLIDWAKAMTKADGIYWADMYNPHAYSAPRAGLFTPPELHRMDPSGLKQDEALLRSIEKTTWMAIDQDPHHYAVLLNESSAPTL